MIPDLTLALMSSLIGSALLNLLYKSSKSHLKLYTTSYTALTSASQLKSLAILFF